MPKTNTPAKPHLYLLSEVNVAKPTGDKTMPRKFSGVANSGLPFSYGSARAIVDLSDLSYHDPVPVLIEHERSQRAGFGTLTVKDNRLAIEGKLLDNVHGNAVADDADADFPWQMSAHVIAGEIDELKTGETMVNGHTVTGPILILRQCRIPEVSFTPTGVDSETSAVILSDDLKRHAQPLKLSNNPTQSKQKETDMTLEEALNKIAEQDKLIAEQKQTIAALEAEKQELIDEKEALAKEKHAADVEAQLSQAGFTKSEDGKTWQGVSEGTVNVLLSSDAKAAKAIIADLKPKNDNAMPDIFLGEQFASVNTGQGDVKLSNSPLVAAAQARKASE